MSRASFIVLLAVACGGDAVAVGAALATASASANLWPNASSETSPPAGTIVLNDGSSPEWDYRLNVGATAYDGLWVRELDNNHLDYATGAGGGANLFYLSIPCVQGDSFAVSAAVRTVAVDPSHGADDPGRAGVFLTFVDAAGRASGSSDLAMAAGTAWKVVQTHVGFPAAADSTTRAVRIGLIVGGGVRAQFDAIAVTRL